MIARVSRWWTAGGPGPEAVWVGTSLAAGLVLLLTRPAPDWPAGSDWPQYVSAAAWFWDPAHATVWPDWRNPAYPFLLGLLRGGGSFVRAGQHLAALSVVSTILAAAALARLLAGRAAALVAGLTAAGTPLLAVAVHWVNPYPLAAAVNAWALVMAAAAALYPRAATVAGAAALASAAWVVDGRGVGVAVAGVLLALVGVFGAGRPRLLLGLLAAVPAPLWDRVLRARYAVPSLPLDRQIALQHGAFGEVLRSGALSDPALAAACATLPTDPGAAVDPGGPCAAALHAHNLADLVGHGVLPPAFGFAALALLLVPDRAPGAARRVAVALVVFGVPFTAVEVGMRWVVFPDRYVLPYQAALAALVPVALGRVAARIGRPWAAGAAAALALGWAATVWPGAAGRATIAENDRAAAAPGRVIRWLGASVPKGRRVMDCALVDEPLAHAPNSRVSPALRPELPPCSPFAVAPEPGDVLLVRANPPGAADPSVPSPDTIRGWGWTTGPSPSEEYGVWLAAADTGVPR